VPGAASVSKMAYQIFADATADLTGSFAEELSSVKVIPMQVEICGRNYTYGPGGDLSISEFYSMQRKGNFASTSQINPTTYVKHFLPVLQEGKDVLYLSFSSGMSATYQSAQIAAQELQEQFPEQKILCVDTLGATLSEMRLLRETAKMQEKGADLESVAAWAEENRLRICVWFVVDTFDHLRHGGRVSMATAAVGTMLGIKPLLHIDVNGKLENTDKPRGRKKAMTTLISKMEQGWCPDFSQTVTIVHADNPQGAEELKKLVAHKFPESEIEIGELGPVIGAHTGPGLLALIYWGNNR